MACNRFAETIRARALGSPLPADAAAHLAVCSDCQAALEKEERVVAAIDTALDELASTGPAPDFVSRARAHVERAPRWMPAARWTPAAIAAVALLVAAVVVVRSPRESSVVRETPASRPVEVPVVAAAERVGPPPNTARPEARHNARVRRQAVPEPDRLAEVPEVLVPEQQREAVGRLFASLRAGRPEVISMLMSLHAGDPTTDSRGLMTEPILIEPVVVRALPSSEPIFDK